MTGPEHYRRAEQLLTERHVIDDVNHAAAHIHALRHHRPPGATSTSRQGLRISGVLVIQPAPFDSPVRQEAL